MGGPLGRPWWRRPQVVVVSAAAMVGAVVWAVFPTSSGNLLASNAALATTRASNKTCGLADGGVVILGSNAPCVDTVGLNVEASGTNLLLRSQAMANAAWTPTAVTATDNAYLAPDGTTTADSLAWTNAVNGLQSSTTSSAAALYTASAWVNAASGTPNVTVVVRDTTAASDLCTSTVATSAAWQRISCTIPSNATAAHALALVLRGTNGTTMGAWGAQLEQSGFVTSYVATTGTTATRASDNVVSAQAVVTGATPSFSADVVTSDIGLGNTPQAIAIYNASNDRWGMFLLSSPPGVLDCDYNNGSEFNAISAAAVTAGVKAHLRCYYDGTNFVACVNGACSPSARTFTATASQGSVAIGWSGWASQNWWNGTVTNACIANTVSGCL